MDYKFYKIAVCIHLFYIEQFDEICNCLNNFLDIEYDLYFTLPLTNKPFVPDIIKKYKNAEIIYTENIGFDIYPFLCFLDKIDLKKYDLIFKIQTKKYIPIPFVRAGNDLSKDNWRKFLMLSLLGTNYQIKYILYLFKNNPHLGMIGSRNCLIQDYNEFAQDIQVAKVEEVLHEIKLFPRRWEFVAGSMFAVRSCLLRKIKERHFLKSDFPPYFPRDWNSLPYLLERVFGCMVSSQGFFLGGVDMPRNINNGGNFVCI